MRGIKKWLKIVGMLMLAIVALALILNIVVNIPAVQNFLAKKVTERLSAQLRTRVSIAHVQLQLFNRLQVNQAYIEDLRHDTLLYAGRLQLRITDFFFLSKHPVIHFLELQDVKLHLSRQPGDSIWNYQFLLDAFSSGNASSAQTQPATIPDIRRVILKNIRVDQRDGWTGQDIHLQLAVLDMRAQRTDFRRHRLIIQRLNLTEPFFSLYQYPGTAPPDTIPQHASPSATDTWNPDHWQVLVQSLRIQNGAFAIDDTSKLVDAPYFDPAHIHIHHIMLQMDSLQWQQDTITARLKLAATERSGFQIQSLSCRFKFSPVIMEFSQLELRTPHSHLGNYYAMQFKHFADMGDYIRRVTMVAHLQQAIVHSDDIAYFAPALQAWHTRMILSGDAKGTVNDLRIRHLELQAGNRSSLQANLQINGLPDIQETFLDAQINNLTTNSTDLQHWFPTLGNALPVNLSALGIIHFNGSFTGFLHDFVAYGNFSTAIGFVHSDLNMKIGRQRIPVYSGKLAAREFDLGKFLNSQALGPTSFQAQLNGQGLNLNSLHASITGDFTKLTIKQYPYQHIHVQGIFQKKLFDGLLAMRDTNANLDFKGTIDLNDSLPHFDFQSTVFRADLHNLLLTNDSIAFSGKLDLHMQGNKIDNFLGNIRLYHVNLLKNNQRIAFDSLHITSQINANQEKLLTIQGNEMKGYLEGHFNLQSLPAAFQLFLNQYFPSYIQKPSGWLPDENFRFSIQTQHVDPYLKAFTKGWRGMDNINLSGSINMLTNALELQADIPYVAYQQIQWHNIHLHAQGNLRQLSLQTHIENIMMGDSLLAPQTSIVAQAAHDTSFVSLQTSLPRYQINSELYARLITHPNDVNIQLLNAAILISDKEWHVNEQNEMHLQNQHLRIRNLSFSQNNQQIFIQSDSLGETYRIHIQDLIVSDFSNLFMQQTRLEGLATGDIILQHPFQQMSLQMNLHDADMRLNNQSLGDMQLQAEYQQPAQLLRFQISSPQLTGKGTLDLANQDLPTSGTLSLQSANLRTLNPYLTDYVSQVQGYATGEISWNGTLNALNVTSNLQLDSLGMKVNYLGTTYLFAPTTLQITPQLIRFNSARLFDDKGNQAELSGEITHNHFHDLRFNLSLQTQQFHFLHTTYFDNQSYYGDAFAAGTISFTGPLNNMQMFIRATPMPGTHLYLPISDSKDIGQHDFIVFKTYGSEVNAIKRPPKDVDLTIHLLAEMNTNARIDVILDANTGDAITATGNGTLNMNISLNGNISMYGTYTIEEGTYTFTFQRLIPKRFQIDPGSTITWNGSPYEAYLNVTAVYHVPGGASLYNLLAAEAANNPGLYGPDLMRTQRVDVNLKLTGKLSKPDINFSIDLPDEEVGGSYAITRMKQITQDPNQLLNQVVGLLIFGQFLPEANTAASSNTNLLRSGGLSSVGAILSAQGTSQLNNLLNRVLKDKSLGVQLNYNPYSASLTEGDALQRNALSVGITKSFLNNRIRVEIGPQWDWGRSYGPYNYTSYFDPIGDFQFEYFVTPDGRIRLTAFRRSSYNVLLENDRTIYGVGISYKRQFDYLYDHFFGKKPTDSSQMPANEHASTSHLSDSTLHQKSGFDEQP
ncbi:MAG: translocation/assembly module TamB domain-containing protein [Thermoflavifilum sp.]|nr:translocation/assembly module TamB domain-containing protein [Thermoflavifilum sp.]